MGRVTLLGDFVHAMQLNLGQGGCMAIEDSYQLALELDKAWRQSIELGNPIDIVSSLKRYEESRTIRVAVIHGMARMAALVTSIYKSYLGVGCGPLSFLTKFRIRHPGIVGGRFSIDFAMPLMLSWVLVGNRWFLLPCGNETGHSQPICLSRHESRPCIIGRRAHEDFPGTSIAIPLPQVSAMHARVSYKDGAFFLTDL